MNRGMPGVTLEMFPPLWQLKVSRVKYDGHDLVKFEHRAEHPLFDGKPFRCVDFAGVVMGDGSTLEKARSFSRSLGFMFPLPIRAESAFVIFSLRDFPALAIWEAAKKDYSVENYQADLKHWYQQRLAIKSFPELYAMLGKLYKACASTSDEQARAKHSLVSLFHYKSDFERLERCYGKEETPEKVVHALEKLEAWGSIFISEKSAAAKKKGERSAAEQHSKRETPEPKGRGKKKADDKQQLLW